MKGFASNLSPITRKKSKFYKFDGKTESTVKIETQCRSPYYYSRNDPEGVEKGISIFEEELLRLSEKLKSGIALTEKEHWKLTHNIFFLHFRNVAYFNRTGDERATRLVRDIYNYIKQILMSDGKRTIYNWKNKLVKTDTDPLITSDHPVLFFYFRSSPLMLILPVYPESAVITYDQTKIRPTSTVISMQDVGYLNGYQAMQCINDVFSSAPFPPSEIPIYTKVLTDGKRNRGWSDSYGMSLEQINLDESNKNKFSFLKII